MNEERCHSSEWAVQQLANELQKAKQVGASGCMIRRLLSRGSGCSHLMWLTTLWQKFDDSVMADAEVLFLSVPRLLDYSQSKCGARILLRSIECSLLSLGHGPLWSISMLCSSLHFWLLCQVTVEKSKLVASLEGEIAHLHHNVELLEQSKERTNLRLQQAVEHLYAREERLRELQGDLTDSHKKIDEGAHREVALEATIKAMTANLEEQHGSLAAKDILIADQQCKMDNLDLVLQTLKERLKVADARADANSVASEGLERELRDARGAKHQQANVKDKRRAHQTTGSAEAEQLAAMPGTQVHRGTQEEAMRSAGIAGNAEHEAASAATQAISGSRVEHGADAIAGGPQAQIVELQTRVADLQTLSATLAGSVAVHQGEVAELRRQVDMEQALRKLQEDCVAGQAAEMATIRAAKDTLDMLVADLKAALAGAKASVVSLSADREGLDAALVEKQAELLSCQGGLEAARVEVASLQLELHKLQKNVDASEAGDPVPEAVPPAQSALELRSKAVLLSRADLLAEEDVAQAERHATEEELGDLRAKLATCKAELAQRNADYAEKSLELEHLKAGLKAADQNLMYQNSIQQDATNHTKEIQRLQEEMAAARQSLMQEQQKRLEMAALTHRLQAELNSMSAKMVEFKRSAGVKPEPMRIMEPESPAGSPRSSASSFISPFDGLYSVSVSKRNPEENLEQKVKGLEKTVEKWKAFEQTARQHAASKKQELELNAKLLVDAGRENEKHVAKEQALGEELQRLSACLKEQQYLAAAAREQADCAVADAKQAQVSLAAKEESWSQQLGVIAMLETKLAEAVEAREIEATKLQVCLLNLESELNTARNAETKAVQELTSALAQIDRAKEQVSELESCRLQLKSALEEAQQKSEEAAVRLAEERHKEVEKLDRKLRDGLERERNLERKLIDVEGTVAKYEMQTKAAKGEMTRMTRQLEEASKVLREREEECCKARVCLEQEEQHVAALQTDICKLQAQSAEATQAHAHQLEDLRNRLSKKVLEVGILEQQLVELQVRANAGTDGSKVPNAQEVEQLQSGSSVEAEVQAHTEAALDNGTARPQEMEAKLVSIDSDDPGGRTDQLQVHDHSML